VVDHLELGPFLAAYRADGHGRAAYDPKMLLGVLLYAYCTGIRWFRVSRALLPSCNRLLWRTGDDAAPEGVELLQSRRMRSRPRSASSWSGRERT
jgi:transposase